MTKQLYDIIQLFAITWFVGFAFSLIKQSNFIIKNTLLIRFLFIKKYPVPLLSIIWQITNYVFFLFLLLNYNANFIEYKFSLKLYSTTFYYGFFIIVCLGVIDGIISEVRKGNRLI